MMNEITNTEHITKRHRRHTIARPASALALISDSSASEDEEDNDQFDRISDILSNLIQEANEAVNYEKVTPPSTATSIPLIRKLSSSNNTDSVQRKRLHKTSRPVSYPSSSSLISVRRRSSATIVPRPSVTNLATRTVVKRQKSGNEITESFKRLDSSLAMIDSLSRDLVPEKVSFAISKKSMISAPFDSRLSALLLLPLLHVPHALISMVFDTIASPDNNMGNNNTLGGMVVWAFIFAITNLVVDKAVNTPKNPLSTKLLPGTFEQQQQIKAIQNKKRPKMYKKRNSRQQQLYFQQQQQQQQQQSPVHLLERKSILSRRNSL